MNERFWTTKDPDYWYHERERRNRDDRYYDDLRRDDRYENYDRERYGEPDPSFYYGGFRDKRHMGRIYSGNENFGSSGYGHSGQMHQRGRDYGDRERYRNEGNRDPRYYEDERFGESHQHRHHARTSDTWDRPAAYNTGGYGSADFGRYGDRRPDEPGRDDRNRDTGRRDYDDRGYRGQGYEDIHRWRGW